MLRNSRRSLSGSTDLIAFAPLTPDRALPRLATATLPGLELAAWAAANADRISAELDRYGAVLFRGFGIDSVERLSCASRAISGEPAEYVERRSPRTQLGEGVFTSTIHPADQYIHFHNETSYSHQWPMRLHFCCIRPAEDGGWTPLADSRRVLQRLTLATRERFLRHGVRYVRNYREGFGMSWQESFQTDEPAAVERFCRQASIAFEWTGGGRLRTWQNRHAVAVHPRTGEHVWFNQAHHFHTRSLPREVERTLRAACAEEDLPQHAYYGDGTPIPDETIDEIVACFRAEEAAFPWERGDLLVVDNMLAAHSRTPYTGERMIALSLSGLYSPPYAGGGLIGASAVESRADAV